MDATRSGLAPDPRPGRRRDGQRDGQRELAETLTRLAARLARQWTFEYALAGGVLHIDLLRAPVLGRGRGTRFLARVLAAADRAGVPVTLVADPSDYDDEPRTEDLLRWYRRFGFVVTHFDAEIDSPALRRAPRPALGGAAAVLRAYDAARGGTAQGRPGPTAGELRESLPVRPTPDLEAEAALAAAPDAAPRRSAPD